MDLDPDPDPDPTKQVEPTFDRDEKVKLDVPFEQALRALLETQPEPETATPDERQNPPTKR